MYRIFLLYFITVLTFLSCSSDSVNDEQLVYETVQAFTKHWKEGNTDEYLKFVHEDYCGFYQDRDSVVYKADHAAWMRGRINKIIKAESKPVAINVYGNVAIVHINLSWTSLNGKGEMVDYKGKYTDILIKEEDKWLFVGDHGGMQ